MLRVHMRARQIVFRSLTYYWRTNVAVVLGVATAVAVLAGALLVGDSVRGSLRDLLLGRLGRTDQVVASADLFREQLAQDLATQPEFERAFAAECPLVVAQGMLRRKNEGRRVAQARGLRCGRSLLAFPWRVRRYVARRIGEAFLSPALAQPISVRTLDESILVRVQRPTDIPLESLHGQRDKV